MIQSLYSSCRERDFLHNKFSCLTDTRRMIYYNITKETANVQDITEMVWEDFEDITLGTGAG